MALNVKLSKKHPQNNIVNVFTPTFDRINLSVFRFTKRSRNYDELIFLGGLLSMFNSIGDDNKPVTWNEFKEAHAKIKEDYSEYKKTQENKDQ